MSFISGTRLWCNLSQQLCLLGSRVRAEFLSHGTRSGKRDPGRQRHMVYGEGVGYVPCVGEAQRVAPGYLGSL